MSSNTNAVQARNISSPPNRKNKEKNSVLYSESLVSLNRIDQVVSQLKSEGQNGCYVIFSFDTPIVNESAIENSLSLQYSIENGKVGLDWVLVDARNIADKDELIMFVKYCGFAIVETNMNDCSYLRVEEGNIASLGTRIATELYKLDLLAEIGLIVEGIEFIPELDMSEIEDYVRSLATQHGLLEYVDQVSTVLRFIHGKPLTADGENPSFADFISYLGTIGFTTELDDQGDNVLLSEILLEPITEKMEELFLGVKGINFLSVCGYRRSFFEDGEGGFVAYYYKYFPISSPKDFTKIAEFCVGVLQYLFEHKPGQPLDVDFFVPGPAEESLLLGEQLPEPMRKAYNNFMSEVHEAISKYHLVMAIDSAKLTKSKQKKIATALDELERALEQMPLWIAKTKGLGNEFSHYFSYVSDYHTELRLSLNDLRRTHNGHVVH